MPHTRTSLTFVALFFLLCVQTVAAQNDQISFDLDGGMAFQSSADLKDSEGSFSVNRWFVSMGLKYAWDART